MTKRIKLKDLENSEVVIADIEKDVEILNNEKIKIKATVEKKETKITEQKNKLGIICRKKETVIKKIPINIQGDINVIPQFVKLINRKKLINLICENINYSYGDYHKYNTTNTSIEEVQEFYPGAYDISFKEKKENLSNRELQENYYYRSKFQIKIVKIDTYDLSQAIIKKVKKRLKKELKNLKFKIYSDFLSFGIKNLKNHIPTKLIGSFNGNEVKHLYNLDAFYWDFKNNKTKSQNYFSNEESNFIGEFDLIGFSDSEKNLCEIDKEDIVTPEEYLEKKGISINNLSVETNVKELALKKYYEEAEETFQKLYGEDIKKLQELFS